MPDTCLSRNKKKGSPATDVSLRNLPRLVPEAGLSTVPGAKKHGGHGQGACFPSGTRAAEAAQPSRERRRVPYFEVCRKTDPKHWPGSSVGVKGGGNRRFDKWNFLSGKGKKSVKLGPQ